MPKRKHETADIREAMGDIADDVRALLEVTTDVAQDRVVNARKRVQATLDAAKSTYTRGQNSAAARVKAADGYIRENPYQSMGLAFGLGAVVGMLLCRGRSED